jgi:hypothetical protein
LVQEPELTAVNLGRAEDAMRQAAAPSAQAGAKAVDRAARESELAAITVTAAAEEMDYQLRARSGIAPTQRVGGRLFVLRDSVWTDLRHGDSLRLVTVEPFSPAYFELLRALPELRGAAALDRVLVAGARLSLEFEAGGKREWSEGELARIVRGFRG